MARGLVGLVAVIAAFIVSPAVASAATLVAAPGGDNLQSCIAPDPPCEIHRAFTQANSPDDEVIITAGDYGSPADPLDGTIASAQPGITVHGEAGQLRPRVFVETTSNNAGISLTGQDATIRHVEIQVHPMAAMGSKQVGLLLDNARGSDMIVTSVSPEGRGCVVLHTSRLTDSVCHATQTNAKGVATYTGVGPGTTNNSVLRNVTAIATNTAGRGIEALGSANPGEEQVLTVSNTIARGQPGQADVAVLYPVPPPPPSEVTILLDHSNFGFESYPQPGNDRVLDGPGGGNQRFITAGFIAPDDFHQAPGSATIDAGATSPNNGPTDFDGDPRTLGSNPDIGADEFVPPPTATTGDPGATTDSTAVVNAIVNPNLVASTYHFEFGPTTAYGSSTPEVDAGAGNAAIAPTETLTGLDPNTTYHYRIVATSRGGTTAGADRTVTTRPRDGGGGGGGTGELQSLGLSPKAFAAAGRGPSVRAAPRGRKPPVGTTVSFRLSDAATVRFKVEKRVKRRGGRVGTRFVPVKGSFGVVGEAGQNQFKFTGRLRGRKLKVGRYRLRGTAGGEIERVKFRIVPQ